MKHTSKTISAVLSASLLAFVFTGCGGGGGSSNGDTSSSSSSVSSSSSSSSVSSVSSSSESSSSSSSSAVAYVETNGHFVDAPVAGLDYVCNQSGFYGVTGISKNGVEILPRTYTGDFHCATVDTNVTFSIGSNPKIVLGTIDLTNFSDDYSISPLDFFDLSNEDNYEDVKFLVQFLQNLSKDSHKSDPFENEMVIDEAKVSEFIDSLNTTSAELDMFSQYDAASYYKMNSDDIIDTLKAINGDNFISKEVAFYNFLKYMQENEEYQNSTYDNVVKNDQSGYDYIGTKWIVGSDTTSVYVFPTPSAGEVSKSYCQYKVEDKSELITVDMTNTGVTSFPVQINISSYVKGKYSMNQNFRYSQADIDAAAQNGVDLFDYDTLNGDYEDTGLGQAVLVRDIEDAVDISAFGSNYEMNRDFNKYAFDFVELQSSQMIYRSGNDYQIVYKGTGEKIQGIESVTCHDETERVYSLSEYDYVLEEDNGVVLPTMAASRSIGTNPLNLPLPVFKH